MAPLLFAAAVAFSPATPPGQPLTLKFSFGQQSTAQACAKLAQRTVEPGQPQYLRKLGALPPGVEEHAVLRTVDGCPVREIVYAGQTYYLDAPDGGLERDLRATRLSHPNY